MDRAIVHISLPGTDHFSVLCGADLVDTRLSVFPAIASEKATCPACLDELAESLILRANKYRKPDTRSIGLDIDPTGYKPKYVVDKGNKNA